LSDLVADVRALTPTEAAQLVVPSSTEIATILHNLQVRLASSLRGRAAEARSRLESLQQRRVLRLPWERIHDLGRRLDEMELRLRRAIRNRNKAHVIASPAWPARLESLSPVAVLSRGYSMTEQVRNGQLVTNAAELVIGDLLKTRFGKGQAISRVEEVV